MATLAAALAAGQSPEALLAALRPQAERDVLRRCALTPTFDQGLYESVLALQDGKAPAFEAIVGAPEVQRVPRKSGVYRLRSAARAELWRSWWPTGPPAERGALPEELRTVAAALAEQHRAHGEQVALLGDLVIVEPHAAAELFRAAYEAADRAFDLPRCQDLVGALAAPDRRFLLTPELKDLQTDYAAYLGARSQWAAEYYQTARYLERTGAMDAYERLLRDERPRSLNLHAPGGAGKTMQLRWLIARRLIPRVDEEGPLAGCIPCAKVDFDFVDPVRTTRYPWLLLLEFAAQLNQQLPEGPFNELLEKHGWLTPLLRRNPADQKRVDAASRRLLGAGEDLTNQLVTNAFRRKLAEEARDRPIVLVFDTVEEIHLRPEGNILALIELVNSLLEDIPEARLIVAGRYSVAEILEPLHIEAPPMIDAPVEPFDAEESMGYLSELRDVGTQEQREAIVERAGGDPFTLSLLADIVAERPRLSAHEIRRHPADVIRLIRRIVNRIPEPGVRWTLRYGVVPRTLSLPFLEAVMWPHLRDGMTGAGELDTPDEDEHGEELGGEAPSFATQVVPPPPKQLWDQLRKYAGSTSWVYEVPLAEDTLRFRSEVVVPMRRLIRGKPIYRTLHEEAARYFEDRAREEPEGWTRWTREAIYHRFQLEGCHAEPYWREVLDKVGYDDPERREQIAAELLEPDYVDREIPLRFDEQTPMVTLDAMIEAHFERACALSELVRDDGAAPDDHRWGDIERSREAILRLQAQAQREVVSQAGVGYLDAGLALRFNDVEAAAREIDGALYAAQTPVELTRLRLLLGDVQLASHDPRAPATLRSALDAARRLRESQRWQATIRREIVVAELMLDQLPEAADDLEQALARAQRLGPEERTRLLVLGAEIALRAGRYDMAERTGGQALDERGGWRAWQLRVAALRAAHDASAAWKVAGQAVTASEATGSAGTVTASPETAGAAELQGITAGALMDFDLAFDALERARRLWNSAGDIESVARCSIEAALLKMRGAGDLNVAEHHLAEAREVCPPALSETWLRIATADAELHATQGDVAEAAARLTRLLEAIAAAGDPPRLILPAATAALAWGGDELHQPALARLVKACRRLEPAAAIALLTGLRGVADVDGDPGPLHELQRLLGRSRDARLSAHDRAVQRMTLAELDRLRDDHDGARSLLRAARTVLRKRGSSFWLREWASAAARLDPLALPPAPEDERRFGEEFADRPMLRAAYLIERAEAEAAGAPREARRRLAEADRLLEGGQDVQTQWHARSQRTHGVIEKHVGTGAESRVVAAEMIGAAAGVLVGLGQKRRRRDLRDVDSAPLDALAHEHARLRLSATADGRLEVAGRVPLPAGERRHSSVATPSPRMDAILKAPPSIREAAFEPFLAGWLGDPESLPLELASSLLPQPGGLEPAPDPGALVQLEVGDRRLQALPWEMARWPDGRSLPLVRVGPEPAEARDTVLFTQVALARLGHLEAPRDGVYGPITTEAMRRYQAAAGLPVDGMPSTPAIERLQHDAAAANARKGQETVILVQPSTTRQLWGARGKASFGLDVEWLYRSAGFSVIRVEDPTIDSIQSVTHGALDSGVVPAILHLSGGLRELGGGIAFTFLAGEWHVEALSGEHSSDELPVTALDHVLESFPRDEFRPLVILDVDRPRGLAETATSMLLRNVYAADLFALGRCPAVIAMGLVPGADADPYPTLVHSLESGLSVADACAAIRSLDEPWSPALHTRPALTGTALFTHLPWLRLRTS